MEWSNKNGMVHDDEVSSHAVSVCITKGSEMDAVEKSNLTRANKDRQKLQPRITPERGDHVDQDDVATVADKTRELETDTIRKKEEHSCVIIRTRTRRRR